jgi:hypothetical protein
MRDFKINIAQNAVAVLPEVQYVFRVLGQNANIRFGINTSAEGNAPSVGLDRNTIVISKNFLDRTLNKNQLTSFGFFVNENGQPDYLGTAFFLPQLHAGNSG